MNQRQQEILEYIQNYPHAYAPIVREIAVAVGLSSTSSVHTYLKKLEEKGYIERRHNCAKCISLKLR